MWRSPDTGGRKVSVDERRALIVEEVMRRASLQVFDICERFGVSEVTARNDLDKLEKSGKLRRTHGGAVPIARAVTVSCPDRRMNVNVEAKRAVAECAASLVSDGDTLLVDTGTTTFEFVQLLNDKNDLTIVTSDLSIASFADSNLPRAQILLLGGMLRKNHRYATGDITTGVMDSLFVDRAFLATDSFSPEGGFTTDHVGNASVKSHMLSHARERIMLMDASKVRDPGLVRFAGIDDFDIVVTDYDPEGVLSDAVTESERYVRLIVTGAE